MACKATSITLKRLIKSTIARRKAIRRLWRLSNKDKIKQYNKRYRSKNKARCAKLVDKWKNKHPKRWLAFMRKGSKKYASTEKGKLKRRANEAARRARNNSCNGRYTPEEWLLLKHKYKYRCLRCGKREPRIKLVADHVIPLVLGGSGKIGNIQPLCNFCNNIKYTLSTDYRNK